MIENSIDFVLHHCFLMRSKERVFSEEKQERERVQKKEKWRKEKKLVSIEQADYFNR